MPVPITVVPTEKVTVPATMLIAGGGVTQDCSVRGLPKEALAGESVVTVFCRVTFSVLFSLDPAKLESPL